MRSFIVGVRAMLIALVVLIVAPVFAQNAAGVEHASPAARGIAEPSVPSENLDDTTGEGGNTEHCGPIDPGTPCYSSGGDKYKMCPKNTSYDNCMARCLCIYKEQEKVCKWQQSCIQKALLNKEDCDGGCLSDWVP